MLPSPLEPDAQSALRIVEVRQAEFDAVWHHHPEVELTLIHKGSGRRFVGGEFGDFRAGELVLIGSGIPHFWRSDPGDAPWRAEATSIQFNPSALGLGKNGLRDLGALRQLIEGGSPGIAFASANAVRHAFERLRRAVGWRRVSLLVEILGTLADLGSTTTRVLGHDRFPKVSRPGAIDARLNSALQFIFGRLAERLTLDEVAAAAGMPRFTFCRFFRRAMGCGLSEFVNDSRIALACQLLRSADREVSRIAFDSGFGTLTNFNRVFKKHMKMTPTDYRRSASGLG